MCVLTSRVLPLTRLGVQRAEVGSRGFVAMHSGLSNGQAHPPVFGAVGFEGS